MQPFISLKRSRRRNGMTRLLGLCLVQTDLQFFRSAPRPLGSRLPATSRMSRSLFRSARVQALQSAIKEAPATPWSS